MTTIRQFNRIALAMLAMTGRVTMLGISRWTGQGGSYRTVHRFFATPLPWATLFWRFFRTHLFDPTDVYLLAGDETVVTKAGKHTPGLDRFFAGLYGKPIPGLAFFTLALISTNERRAFPIALEQVVRSAEEKAAIQATVAKAAAKPAAKRKPGRPKGSTPTAHTTLALSPKLTRIQTLIRTLLRRIGGLLPLTYLVLDGHFGNAAALQMALACPLQLISKCATIARYTSPRMARMPGTGRTASTGTSSIRVPFLHAFCAKRPSTRVSKRAPISCKRGIKRWPSHSTSW